MRGALLALGCLAFAHPAVGQPVLSFPVDCELGETCFLQQLVDMDPGPDARDAVCGIASYNGHTGTDVRVPQLIDTAAHGRVIAAAAGTVSAVRDGEADRLMMTQADRDAVGQRGCGNGVVVDHSDGWQTQYCHLARGSIGVAVGDSVQAGQELGAIGLSGSTQFPHLEFIVRHNGTVIDPFSGQDAGSGCGGEMASLWDDPSTAAAAALTSQFIGAGLSSDVIDHNTLMLDDPLPLYVDAQAVVGWGWAINVQEGDIFQFEMTGPGGFTYSHTSEPVGRDQAAYSAFAGARVAVVAGRYSGAVTLRRGDEVIDREAFASIVE